MKRWPWYTIPNSRDHSDKDKCFSRGCEQWAEACSLQEESQIERPLKRVLGVPAQRFGGGHRSFRKNLDAQGWMKKRSVLWQQLL